MAGSDSYNGDGPVANINVTPLVDVMLVLLVIFMVTAPMLQQGVEVDLPKATTAPLKEPAENNVILSVNKEGTVFLGSGEKGEGNEIAVDELPAKVRAIMEKRPEAQRKIYVKGDTGISYGRIMEVMGKLHEGGINQIGLISAPPEGGKKGRS